MKEAAPYTRQETGAKAHAALRAYPKAILSLYALLAVALRIWHFILGTAACRLPIA